MRAALVAFAASLVACSPSEPPNPQQPASTQPAATVPTPPSQAVVRTMKSVSLFGGTSIHNLLIDPSFESGDPGIGRWYVNVATGGLTLDQVVTASAPAGMSLPVGSVSGVPDGGGAPKAINMFAQVPGGKGPYSVSVWASTETPNDGDVSTLVKVSLAQLTGAAATDIAPDPTATRVIDGRTWIRFRGVAKVDTFTLGAILYLKVPKPGRARYWFQAPEVVPTALETGSASVLSSPWRPLDADERAALDAAKRIPLDIGIRSLGQKKTPI